MIKRFFYSTPLSIIALSGIYLNTIYFFMYFINSGYNPEISKIMSISFIVFESALWLYKFNFKSINILKLCLVFFSIFVTMSVQYSDTSEVQSENKIEVFEKSDITNDVKYYREQISILDLRIDEFINQQLVFGSEKNRVERENAESEKSLYKLELEKLQDKKQVEIEDIYEDKSIYKWIAEDLPLIFKSGINENLVRVLFQAFSSVILGLMAPVCLSLVRGYRPEKPHKKPVKKNIFKWFKKHKPTVLSTKIDKKVQKPAVKQEVQAINQPTMSVIDRKNILKMLLWRLDDTRKIETPDKAAQLFVATHKDRPEIKAYSAQECEVVYKELIGRKVAGMSKSEVIEEIMNG